MQTLKQLIDQFCPDGVEYVRLGDVVDYEQPTKYLVKSTNYDDSLTTPVLTAGKTFLLGYTAETDGIYEANPTSPVIIFDDFTTANKWVNFPFKAKSSAMKILTAKNDTASLRFVYLAMRDVEVDTTDHKRQWIGTYSNELIPLPPREVQDKIVEYLDTFAALCENLDTEIAQREQQFAEYREMLLTRPELSASTLTLGDFLDLRAGRNIKSSEISMEPTGDRHTPCIGGNGLRGFVNLTSHSGDFSVVGRQGALCGNVNWVSGDFYATEHAVVVTPNEDVAVARYTYHLLTLMDLNQYASKSAQPGLAVSTLKKLTVDLPPLETQQAIADKLDAMQAVIDNLRLEREQRQRQFYFYREKLLSFTPKETEEG